MRTLIDLQEISFAEGSKESWIQIMKTGSFNHPVYGEMKITQDDLQKFKENFDANVRGIKLFADVNHDDNHAAVAEFKELRVEPGKLMALMEWNAKGEQLIKSGEYKYFSPEFAFSYTDSETGKKYEDVLLGGGITNRPFLKGMQEISLSEMEFADADYKFHKHSPDEPVASDATPDPDGDGDDDRTTDPKRNPDWIDDVKNGITRYPSNSDQQTILQRLGITKVDADKAYMLRKGRKPGKTQMSEPVAMSEGEFVELMIALAEDDVTNAHKSPPKGKPQEKGDYADPAHYKYPIDAKHIKAAVSYFNHDEQQEKGGYSDDEWAQIGNKICAAANKLIGPGHSFKDGKIDTSSVKMDDGMNPNDGDNSTKPTDDVDAGQYSEPAKHKSTPNGGVHMSEVTTTPQGGAGQGGAGEQAISLAEYNALQQEVRVLKEANRRARLSETVNGFLFNEGTKKGKILPAQRDKVLDLMAGMNDEQVKQFTEFVNELPDAIAFGEEHGHGQSGKMESRDQIVEKRAAVLMSEKGMSFRDALISADAEIPRV